MTDYESARIVVQYLRDHECPVAVRIAGENVWEYVQKKEKERPEESPRLGCDPRHQPS
jgi:hypothetical protein